MQTHFKETLSKELADIIDSIPIDEEFVKLTFVEDKSHLTSELVDYYTEDLLKYDEFSKEFTNEDLVELRNFILILKTTPPKNWGIIQASARALLNRLNERA